MGARPIPTLGTHSAVTEIFTAVVGRWQHFVSADPAQKANLVLPRRVTVASNGSNYVTLRILFFADIIVAYTVMKRIHLSGAQKRAVQ